MKIKSDQKRHDSIFKFSVAEFSGRFCFAFLSTWRTTTVAYWQNRLEVEGWRFLFHPNHHWKKCHFRFFQWHHHKYFGTVRPKLLNFKETNILKDPITKGDLFFCFAFCGLFSPLPGLNVTMKRLGNSGRNRILTPYPKASIAHHVIHFFDQKNQNLRLFWYPGQPWHSEICCSTWCLSHTQNVLMKNHLQITLPPSFLFWFFLFPECSAAKFSALFCVQAYWILGGP